MTPEMISEMLQQSPTFAFALLVWYELRLLRSEVTRVLTIQLQNDKYYLLDKLRDLFGKKNNFVIKVRQV